MHHLHAFRKIYLIHQQQWKKERLAMETIILMFQETNNLGHLKIFSAIIDINSSLKFLTFLLFDNHSTLPKVAREWRNKTYAKLFKGLQI